MAGPADLVFFLTYAGSPFFYLALIALSPLLLHDGGGILVVM
jgi:hypothetical protein